MDSETVKIEVEKTRDGSTRLRVRVPFHPSFVSRAPTIGSVFCADHWLFHARDEQEVRRLCFEIFGTDGRVVDTCDARIDLSLYARSIAPSSFAIYFAGKLIAARRMDGRVDMGDSVVIVSGYFRKSVGSSAGPAPTPLSPSDGMVVEVRDVPLSLVVNEQLHLDRGGISIVPGSLRLAGPVPSVASPNLARVPAVALVEALVERWAARAPNLCGLIVAAREDRQRAAALLGAMDEAESEENHAVAHAEAWKRIEARAVEQARAKGPHTADDIEF
jgi:hypothetical protein